MSAPRLSVIIATYNKPVHLAKVLAGFERQTQAPDEMLFADDGSGPETAAVIDAFRARVSWPVVHCHHADNGWQKPVILNEAARRATGEYLVTMDDDCVPGTRFLADHRRLCRPGHFVQGKRMFVQESIWQRFTGTEGFWQHFWWWVTRRLEKGHLIFRVPGLARTHGGDKRIRGCNFAIWKRDLERVNGWNTRFRAYGREDTELAIRLLRAGVKRRDALRSAVVYHLHHPHLDRSGMPHNNALMEAARTGPPYVADGMHADTAEASPS